MAAILVEPQERQRGSRPATPSTTTATSISSPSSSSPWRRRPRRRNDRDSRGSLQWTSSGGAIRGGAAGDGVCLPPAEAAAPPVRWPREVVAARRSLHLVDAGNLCQVYATNGGNHSTVGTGNRQKRIRRVFNKRWRLIIYSCFVEVEEAVAQEGEGELWDSVGRSGASGLRWRRWR